MRRVLTSRRRKVVVGLVAGGAVLVVGPWALVNALTYGHRYDSVADVPHRDVALVLGAGLNPDGTPSAFLAQRLDVAAALVRAGKVDKVLVSGDDATLAHNEVASMASYLEGKGVDDRVITLDYAGFDTYDSCYRAKHVFGAASVTVVTQDYHLPRAVFLCRSVGLDAVGVGGSEWGAFTGQMAGYQVRELASDGKALVAGWFTHPGPTYGGPAVPLNG